MEKRISVFVRVKPVDGVQQWEVDPSHTEINSLDKKDKFRFDHIFGRTSTQYEVYGRIQPIVESFLLGYNGSGKTFTTFGNTNNPGIVRQAAGEIFERIQQDSSKSYSIRVSYLEIYNEELKDLINENNKPKVRENAEGFFVSNLDERNVKNQEELMHELNLGDEIRHTRATAMNSLSSRSHALFRITLITESQVKQSEEDGKTSLMQKDEQQNSTIKTKSILYFVDLAGSERLSQTKAEGEAQKEGCNINLSLLTLRKVIQALSINSQKDGRIENNGINSGESQTTKQSHINYRDSKLTMVLKENLQGNSQTAIIVTINPLELYTETTKGSLQFAETAQHVRTIVRINEIIDDKRRIEDLLQECKRLRRLLDQVKSVDNIQQGLLIQSQNYGNGQQSFGIPGQRNTFGIGSRRSSIFNNQVINNQQFGQVLNIPKKRKVSIYGNGNIQDNEDEGFNRPPKPTNAQMSIKQMGQRRAFAIENGQSDKIEPMFYVNNDNDFDYNDINDEQQKNLQLQQKIKELQTEIDKEKQEREIEKKSNEEEKMELIIEKEELERQLCGEHVAELERLLSEAEERICFVEKEKYDACNENMQLKGQLEEYRIQQQENEKDKERIKEKKNNFISLKNELQQQQIQSQSSMTQLSIHLLEEKIDKKEEQIKLLQENIRNMQHSAQSSSGEKQQIERELKDANRKLSSFDGLQQKLKEAENKMREINLEKISAEKKMESAVKESLKRKISQEKVEQDLTLTLNQIKEIRSNTQKDINQYKEKLDIQQAASAILIEKNQQLEDQLSNSQNEINELKECVNKLEQKKQEFERDRIIEKEQFQFEMEKLNECLLIKSKQLNEREIEIESLQQKLQHEIEIYEQIEKEFKLLDQVKNEYERDNLSLQMIIDDSEKRIKQMEEGRQSMENKMCQEIQQLKQSLQSIQIQLSQEQKEKQRSEDELLQIQVEMNESHARWDEDRNNLQQNIIKKNNENDMILHNAIQTQNEISILKISNEKLERQLIEIKNFYENQINIAGEEKSTKEQMLTFQIENLTNQCTTLSEKNQKIISELNEAKLSIQQTNIELQLQKESNENNKSQYQCLKNEYNNLHDAFDKQNQLMIEQETRIREIMQENENIKNKIQISQNEIKQYQSQSIQNKQEIEILQQQLNKSFKDLLSSQNEIQQYQICISQAKEEIQRVREENVKLLSDEMRQNINGALCSAQSKIDLQSEEKNALELQNEQAKRIIEKCLVDNEKLKSQLNFLQNAIYKLNNGQAIIDMADAVGMQTVLDNSLRQVQLREQQIDAMKKEKDEMQFVLIQKMEYIQRLEKIVKYNHRQAQFQKQIQFQQQQSDQQQMNNDQDFHTFYSHSHNMNQMGQKPISFPEESKNTSFINIFDQNIQL